MGWLQRLFGHNPGASTDRPAVEGPGALFDRGGQLRRLDPSDLTPDYAEKLRAVCTAHPSVAAMWILRITHVDGPDELLALLALDPFDEACPMRLAEQAESLGGPRWAVTVVEEAPTS